MVWSSGQGSFFNKTKITASHSLMSETHFTIFDEIDSKSDLQRWNSKRNGQFCYNQIRSILSNNR